MANSQDPSLKNPTVCPPPVTAPPDDIENQETPMFGVSSIIRRWRREDLLNKGSTILRTLGLLFSLLSFIVMGSNKHGDWMHFDRFEEYRYCLAISILSTLYTAAQVLRQIHQFWTGKNIISQRISRFVDFFGDQVTSYLLISSASAAIPLTNQMREGSDNIFTDSSAASISMSFLAFVALALSATISGYKLSNQNNIYAY
ncbi:PREDICTED: CASP-like protein 4B1 [Nelumbo nucifera]|uniref:CASP-like protein n=2 Tax=Nelumbo nucifera TaxID=4432 RepID=A0A822Y7C6_NELNU|nr:PREDICTED: CASP-like protein 4B1 [Nelumbo nucifera]DAD28142.1 TPA_asm: hypothetical protein HUJ06_029610 [Nelumbo nucifera]